MSARKTAAAAAQPLSPSPPSARARKKARAPRLRQPATHFEVRRGEAVILRIAVADAALAEVGDELGALVKRIAPSTRTEVVTPIVEPMPAPEPPSFVFGQRHAEHNATYHAEQRGHLADLFSSLCDSALEDALDLARQERDRRADGSN